MLLMVVMAKALGAPLAEGIFQTSTSLPRGILMTSGRRSGKATRSRNISLLVRQPKIVRNLLKRWRGACKPDSVRRTALQQRTATIIPLGHTSRCGSSNLPEGSRSDQLALIATEGVPLRKRSLTGPGQPSPPIWSCTTRGLPCRRHYWHRGGLLPHLFTLTCARTMKTSRRFSSGLSPGVAPLAVYSLWHCP